MCVITHTHHTHTHSNTSKHAHILKHKQARTHTQTQANTHTHSNTSKHAHIHSCICNSVGLEKLRQGAYVHWSDLNAVLLLQLWWEKRVVISRELWKRKYCRFQTHSLFHFIVHHLILCRNGRGGRALGGWGK